MSEIDNIRSEERVRELAEVFTSENMVANMLDLVGNYTHNINARFLEPTCGHGNFLVQILKRKLETVNNRYKKSKEHEFYSLVAITSLYGVDIEEQNIEETRKRLRDIITSNHKKAVKRAERIQHFDKLVDVVLKTNFVTGNMMTEVSKIFFVEYLTPEPLKFMRRRYCYADMLKAAPDSLWGDHAPATFESKPEYYWDLYNEN